MSKFIFVFTCIAQLVVLLMLPPLALAAEIPPVRLVAGTVSPPTAVVDAVRSALKDSASELPPVDGYAITDVRDAGEWQFVSVVGLQLGDEAQSWNLEDNAVWFGLVAVQSVGDGIYVAEVEVDDGFGQLMSKVPGAVLSVSARDELAEMSVVDRSTMGASGAPGSAYQFPWKAGTSMLYGSRAVHENGFANVVDGWKAVDFISDGSTDSGHAPNAVVAAAAGTVSYLCRDGVSVAARIGNLFYTHLLDNTGLYVGRSFSQGQEIGQLRQGSFDYRCGWASQAPGWFHLHWGFPDTGALSVADWMLSLGDGLWRRGDETRGVGSWLAAGDPAADLYEPDDERDAAAPIEPDWIQKRSLSPVGDVDWIVFRLQRASAIALRAAGDGALEMWLYDSGVLGEPGREPIAGPQPGQEGPALIERACGASELAAGSYYIQVKERGNDGILTYNLTLTVLPCWQGQAALFLPLVRGGR